MAYGLKWQSITRTTKRRMLIGQAFLFMVGVLSVWFQFPVWLLVLSYGWAVIVGLWIIETNPLAIYRNWKKGQRNRWHTD